MEEVLHHFIAALNNNTPRPLFNIGNDVARSLLGQMTIILHHLNLSSYQC